MQPKNNKGAQAKPRQAKGPKANKAQRDVFSTLPSRAATSASSSVSAVNTQHRNPTQLDYAKAKPHPDFGQGVRLTGSQLLSSAVTTAGDSQLFSGGTATVAANSIFLSPDAFGGRLALVARTYSRYAFRRIEIHYEPRVATTQAGAFSLGITGDGYSTGFSTASFAAVTQISPSIVSPFRERARILYKYDADTLFYTEDDPATGAGVRLTNQGQIVGYPDASSIGAVTMGQFWLYYVLDLYCPSMDYGFSLLLRSQDEYDLARTAVEQYRRRPKTPTRGAL